MNIKFYFPALKSFLILTILISLSAHPVLADGSQEVYNQNYESQEEIKSVIKSYFDTRYSMLNSLQLMDFGNLISNSQEGNDFESSELNKLKIDIKNIEFSGLNYLQYEFYLDFQEISYAESNQLATVLLTEGHDIVFEALAPAVSSMRNLEHIITLRKEGEDWKIILEVISKMVKVLQTIEFPS